MSNKKQVKKIQNKYNYLGHIFTIAGIFWQIIWVFILANDGNESLVLWQLILGAFVIALATCLRLAPKYNKVFLFILGGTILIYILTYLIYACVFFVFNFGK